MFSELVEQGELFTRVENLWILFDQEKCFALIIDQKVSTWRTQTVGYRKLRDSPLQEKIGW